MRDDMQQEQIPQRQPMRRTHFVFFAIILVLFCLLAGFIGSAAFSILGDMKDITHLESGQDGNKIVTQEEEDIAGVVQKVGPSVVSVVTSLTQTSFDGTQEYQGAGTGIIVGADGYILTNKHVIEDSKTVSVILSDGTTYDDVKVIGTDPLNDIAFLKIPGASNLPVAQLGDSKSLRIGQKVIAIGNALGQYQNTVTSGIISGTGRPITARSGANLETLTDLIQTDAAINSGNSGGPLLNLQGQVIGMNTAVAEDAQGIGFAIPIAATKGMLKGVLAGKAVEHPFIGVNYVSITPDVATEYKLAVKTGGYVVADSGQSAVVPGGPADKAGVKDKDIITKVNGVEVGDKGSIASLVAEYSSGDTIELTILRSGKELTVKVTLGTYKV